MKWKKPYSNAGKIEDIVMKSISDELGRDVDIKKKKVDMTGGELDSLTLWLDVAQLNEDIVGNVQDGIISNLSIDCDDTKIAEDTEFVVWEFYF